MVVVESSSCNDRNMSDHYVMEFGSRRTNETIR